MWYKVVDLEQRCTSMQRTRLEDIFYELKRDQIVGEILLVNVAKRNHGHLRCSGAPNRRSSRLDNMLLLKYTCCLVES